MRALKSDCVLIVLSRISLRLCNTIINTTDFNHLLFKVIQPGK